MHKKLFVNQDFKWGDNGTLTKMETKEEKQYYNNFRELAHLRKKVYRKFRYWPKDAFLPESLSSLQPTTAQILEMTKSPGRKTPSPDIVKHKPRSGDKRRSGSNSSRNSDTQIKKSPERCSSSSDDRSFFNHG